MQTEDTAALALPDWLVPTLAIGVPAIALLAVVVAQVAAGAGGLLAVRRVLGSRLDRLRRPPSDGA